VAKLTTTIQSYDALHPDEPVQIAVVHDPTRLDAIMGAVPLVLSGHLHKRSVREDKGTRVMVEGSTGGAGLTSAGFQRLTDGDPVPLEATLLYFATSGDRAGQLVAYDAAHATEPVQIAVVHDPTRMDAMLGTVPTVLAGHMHKRSVSEKNGTRVMVEGSTGGAGLTSTGFQRITEGNPVPLEATLLYFAQSGERAGQLVAYDEVTVGGFGLTSVSIDRTTVKPPQPGQPGSDEPAPGSSPTTTPGSTPSAPSPSSSPASAGASPASSAALGPARSPDAVSADSVAAIEVRRREQVT
jgi:predicted phosphodiesterase